jgi:hypothetical protein
MSLLFTKAFLLGSMPLEACVGRVCFVGGGL